MFKVLLVLAMAGIVSAGLVPGQERGTWVEGEVGSVHQIPSIPVLGKGADALVIFAAYLNSSGFAWGDIYWNPTSEQYPSTWSYDTVNPSTVEPDGSPYHWNGGLGTALDNIGYTWEWYPTWDNQDGMQVIPDVTTLGDYYVTFIFTFDNWANAGLSASTVTILSDYMDAGGIVVFVGQDAHFGGISATFLDNYFACGTVIDDVLWAYPTLAATGTAGTFAAGWSGTADELNFSSINPFFPDDLELNGFLTDGTYQFSSYKDATKCIYSTFEFETCDAADVQTITDLIMTYIGAVVPLERSTWGDIKSSF